MELNKRSKSLLEKVFQRNFANPKGINATTFRAEHHDDLELLDKLESSGCLVRRDNKYKLNLVVLLDLPDGLDEVKELLKKCDHIFQVLRQFYLDHPGDSIGLNGLSTMSAHSRDDINISLSYMIDAPIFGGWTGDFFGDRDAKITPAESILRYESFIDVIETMRSWQSEKTSGAIESEPPVDQPVGNTAINKALLNKLERLYSIKEVKGGFPSQQACLDWSNKVAPLLKFNDQYYKNFIANAHKMNLGLSSFTLEPAFKIMVSQLQMAIEELKNDIEIPQDVNGMRDKMGSYIDATRLEDLKSIPKRDFDLKRVINILEELNLCYRDRCYIATISLVRALIDHVPPIFGCRSFSEVANNYGGSKSFKKSMEHLDKSSRNIADQYLHGQIRGTETLPNKTQVNFIPDVDVLLAEIVSILKK